MFWEILGYSYSAYSYNSYVKQQMHSIKYNVCSVTGVPSSGNFLESKEYKPNALTKFCIALVEMIKIVKF